MSWPVHTGKQPLFQYGIRTVLGDIWRSIAQQLPNFLKEPQTTRAHLRVMFVLRNQLTGNGDYVTHNPLRFASTKWRTAKTTRVLIRLRG